jgi:nucleotide-binding universal stress UspA family protein
MEVLARKVAVASGQRVIVRYLLGNPGEELAKLAVRDGIDLVVVSTHARAPLARTLMKSVADHLARKGGVPLLMIRPGDRNTAVELTPSRQFQHVLVPLDGSELAESALHPSLLTGLDPKTTEITLLHVVPHPALMTTPEPVATAELGGSVEAEQATGEEYLAGVANRLAPWGRRVTTSVVTSASTASAIADYAAAHRVDLIAMGTHGRGGIARMLRGSVADAVVRSARIPTLLFPPARVSRKVQAGLSLSPW